MIGANVRFSTNVRADTFLNSYEHTYTLLSTTDSLRAIVYGLQ